MKKKILCFALALCFVFPCMIGLSACNKHTCSWETKWTANETEHWHACKGKNCKEIKDKADHTWNDGEVVAEATEDANGTKKFTCTVCGHEKTESFVFVRTTISDAEEWGKALTFEGVDKYAMTVNTGEYFGEIVIDGTKIHVTEKAKEGNDFVVEDEEYYDQVVSGGETTSYCYRKNTDGEWIKSKTEGYESAASQTDIFVVFQSKFESFEYDQTTKAYKYVGPYVLNNPGVTITFRNVVFKFENGKLVYYSWTGEYVSVNESDTVFQNGEVSYDNISVTLPEIVPVDPRKVKEIIFQNAVLLKYCYNYEHSIEIVEGGLTRNEKTVLEDNNFYFYSNAEMATVSEFITEKYYEKTEDGGVKIYVYNKVGGDWTKKQLIGDEYEEYYTHLPSSYYDYELFAFSYDDFEFDSESGKYVAHNLNVKLMTFTTVELSFFEGKMKEASWKTSDGATYHATITYGSQSVTLPNVESAE